MKDEPIVVISLGPGVEDRDSWAKAIQESPETAILELRVTDQTRAEHLEWLSTMAEDRGITIRLRRLSG
jgi:hypothetical protein